MNANEFVARGGDVEIGLLFVYKEGVRYPNVPYKFGANGQSFHSCPLFVGKSGVSPELPKVEVQGEIL